MPEQDFYAFRIFHKKFSRRCIQDNETFFYAKLGKIKKRSKELKKQPVVDINLPSVKKKWNKKEDGSSTQFALAS